MSKLKKIKESIIGLLATIIIVWILITNMVYMFINHSQTEIERISNFWYAITCQWNRDVYEREKE